LTIEIPLSVLVALFAINGGTLTAFLGAIVYLALRLGRLPTREEHNELRQDLKSDMTQLREEFRRSHQQLMIALGNHSHREDGQAIFTLPPELETTPAPADN
jgi:hypothetical protein